MRQGSRKQAMAAALVCLCVVGCMIALDAAERGIFSSDGEPAPFNDSDAEIAVADAGEQWHEEHLTISGEELGLLQRQIIVGFFEVSYRSLSGLSTGDLTAYFGSSREARESAALNQTALELQTATRAMQMGDLSFEDYDVELTVEQVFDDEEGFNVIISENSRIRFALSPGVDSYTAGVTHLFVFVEEEDGISLLRHAKSEDVYVLMSGEYEYEKSIQGIGENDMSAEQIESFVAAVGDSLLAEARENAALHAGERAEFIADSAALLYPEVEYDHRYDSSAALAYAYKWVDADEIVRNTAEWQTYDDYGGNCNNYTSQCVYAGGIPMDVTGSIGYQWKWCGDQLSGAQRLVGRSSSWSGVSEFYEYALLNQGNGLVAWSGGNVYAGQPGDVLQYGAANEWRHSVIITKVITGADGGVIDYLINSNTTDRIDYPASAYAYTDLRLVKIIGWND